jgi:hypothetical protein
MSVWAIVRIKHGANCFQDRYFYNWPPGKRKFISDLAGVSDDCVFIAEKKFINGKAEWECYAPGAGYPGQYGSGSINADEVEFITPMLGYKPSEHDRQHAALMVEEQSQ